MAFLYQMHEREKQTKEKREAIRDFLPFLVQERGLRTGLTWDEIEVSLDKFFDIDRVKYAQECVEMEKVRKDLEERRARGESPGSSIPVKGKVR